MTIGFSRRPKTSANRGCSTKSRKIEYTYSRMTLKAFRFSNKNIMSKQMLTIIWLNIQRCQSQNSAHTKPKTKISWTRELNITCWKMTSKLLKIGRLRWASCIKTSRAQKKWSKPRDTPPTELVYNFTSTIINKNCQTSKTISWQAPAKSAVTSKTTSHRSISRNWVVRFRPSLNVKTRETKPQL